MANFELTLSNQRWLQGMDPRKDLCSHGDVCLRIGPNVILDGAPSQDEWCVSAAALFLMRSLFPDIQESLCEGDREHMIPHCGHALYGDGLQVTIIGCPIGVNWNTSHDGGTVLLSEVILRGTTNDEESVRFAGETRVPLRTYASNIASFADAVMSFFESSDPKEPEPHEETGFETYLREMKNLRLRIKLELEI